MPAEAHTQTSPQALHTKLSQAQFVWRGHAVPSWQAVVRRSRDSNTPAPAGLLGDIRSAVRFHGLPRIASVVVRAEVLMSLEAVPIVERVQLVFGIYKPPRQSRQPSKAVAADLPKAASAASAKAPAAGVTKAAASGSNKAAPDIPTKVVPDGSPSHWAALLDKHAELEAQFRRVSMQAYKVAMHDGVIKLARNGALARRHDDKVYGEGSAAVTSNMSLQPQRVTSTGSPGGSFPCAFGIGQPPAGLRVGLTAGTMLFAQTDKELVNIMPGQVGHNYAYHEAESKSWRLLLNTVIIGSLVVSSSMGLLPLAAAAVGIDAVVNKVIVGILLHRRQQYQADAMGVAISMAAGCSADSIISYMQRAHLAEVSDRTVDLQTTSDAFSQTFRARSASLRQLVPKSDLPEGRPFNLQELQAWSCISASEAKTLSPEAKTKFDAEVQALENMLLCFSRCIRDPIQRWVDPYPDWLDRIAYVQGLSLLKTAQPVQKKQTAKMDALQKSLTSLQASKYWPLAVKCMGVKDSKSEAKYSCRLDIRKHSEADLTSKINMHLMASAKCG